MQLHVMEWSFGFLQDTFKAWELPKRAPPAEVQLRQSVPFDATTSYAETYKPYEIQPRHVVQRPQYAGSHDAVQTLCCCCLLLDHSIAS